jgi:hypothetical protein
VWVRRHPLVKALAVVLAAAGVGYAVALVANGTLQDVLLTASTTLLFGVFFGGLVKVWLDDFQLTREARQEQLRFVSAMLADLKSVYDRVERVRVLIGAHRTAKTYGDEMRDVIDAEVQLRNVVRALDQGTSGILEGELEGYLDDTGRAVTSMERYLNSLTSEFRDNYKPIADKPPGETWADLKELPQLREFREYRDDGTADGARYGEGYGLRFVGALDLASWILRAELKRLRGEPLGELPQPLEDVRSALTTQADSGLH